MSVALILQLLAGVGGFAGIGAVINILMSRKKVSNEAADIAQDTSTKLIKNLDSDNQGLRDRIDKIEKDNEDELEEMRKKITDLYDRISGYEEERSVTRIFMYNSISWMQQAETEFSRLGVTMPSPPSAAEVKKYIMAR